MSCAREGTMDRESSKLQVQRQTLLPKVSREVGGDVTRSRDCDDGNSRTPGGEEMGESEDQPL